MIIKKIITILFIVNIGLVKAQYTAIPDGCFENRLIEQGIDTEGILDGQVLTADIETITFLNLDSSPNFCQIFDLTGIQDFTSLITLACPRNRLTSLDVSGLTNLEGLHCDYNEIQSLIINNNPSLKFLYCNFNEIQGTINTNGCPQLNKYYCAFNQITTIDVSNNVQLTNLQIGQNLITSINLTDNVNIVFLGVGANQLTQLDVSNLENLETLHCLLNNELTNLNVSNNIQLKVLNCHDINITNLDLTQNPFLEFLNCKNSSLTNLDIRNGNNNLITTFDTTENPNLTCIFVDDATYSTTNWLDVDPNSTFVETEAACQALATNDFTLNYIKVYPNPVTDFLVIENNSTLPINTIKIYDFIGKEIGNFKNSTKIDFTNYTKGLYTILITTQNGSITKKIVKK